MSRAVGVAVVWSVALIGLASGTPAAAVTSAGAAVSGGPAIGVSPLAAQPVQVINDNGGWCWFQGARAVIGGDGRLLVGSTASSTGAGGSARSGAVEVASFDLRTGTVTQTDRLTGPGQYRSDDHNSPGLAEVAGGRVVAAWAGHNDDWRKQSATLDPTDAAWTVNAATIRGRSTTYSNLLRLPAENGGKGRLYDFFRAEGSAVNAMISDDDGRTWVDAGRLVSNGTLHPYTRFAANGPDRIDFITTSGNPQSVRGSGVRSGFLKGGRIYTTDGRQVGSLGAGVEWGALTPLQLGVPALEGADTDVWTADLVVGPNGPVAALTVKHPRPPNVTGRSFDQEYLYASWTSGAWNVAARGVGRQRALRRAAVLQREPGHRPGERLSGLPVVQREPGRRERAALRGGRRGALGGVRRADQRRRRDLVDLVGHEELGDRQHPAGRRGRPRGIGAPVDAGHLQPLPDVQHGDRRCRGRRAPGDVIGPEGGTDAPRPHGIGRDRELDGRALGGAVRARHGVDGQRLRAAGGARPAPPVRGGHPAAAPTRGSGPTSRVRAVTG